jgi:hypothetical protein
MAGDYCERCDLPLAMCEHGRPFPAAITGLLRRELARGSAGFWQGLWEMVIEAGERSDGLGPWVSARYSGTCCGCGGRWMPGDLIRASDDDGGWLCGGCGGS